MKSIKKLLFTRWAVVVGIILVLGFLFFRSKASNQPKLSFIKPQVQDVAETIEVSGSVDAAAANLKFLGGGKITYLPLKEGDVVKKGQRIASIDARDLEKSLQSSLNDYMSARSTFDQTNDDNKYTVKSDEVLRQLARNQYGLNSAVYAVELRNIALSNSSLYSPINGVLVHSPAEVSGVQVSLTDAFQIVDPSTLKFEGEVDEVDIGRVSVGQKVTIVLDAYPKDKIEATIDSIALNATISTKASGGTVFIVKAKLSNPDIHKYRLGMNGTMTIITKTANNVLTVPLSSVVQRDDKSYVKVKTQKNGKVEAVEREIQVGVEGIDSVEVKSGLNADDEVLAL